MPIKKRQIQQLLSNDESSDSLENGKKQKRSYDYNCGDENLLVPGKAPALLLLRSSASRSDTPSLLHSEESQNKIKLANDMETPCSESLPSSHMSRNESTRAQENIKECIPPKTLLLVRKPRRIVSPQRDNIEIELSRSLQESEKSLALLLLRSYTPPLSHDEKSQNRIRLVNDMGTPSSESLAQSQVPRNETTQHMSLSPILTPHSVRAPQNNESTPIQENIKKCIPFETLSPIKKRRKLVPLQTENLSDHFANESSDANRSDLLNAKKGSYLYFELSFLLGIYIFLEQNDKNRFVYFNR